MAANLLRKRQSQHGIMSVGQRVREGKTNIHIDESLFVHGPTDFDCLADRWSRKEVLGVVGASGIGKTEFVLQMLKTILANNDSGVCIFVSLEMTTDKIASRFYGMLEEDELELADRFHVISNFDDEGKCLSLGTTEISNRLNVHKEVLGDVIAFGLDHLHIIEAEKNQDLNKICQEIKNMAISNNSLAIPLTQVPKGKAQKGDVPLEADAAYNCSQFKWISSYIIQIHRPLIRVEKKNENNVLCWSYVKIREQNKKDKVKVNQNKLLCYDVETRSFRKLTKEESSLFSLNYTEVLKAREEEENDSCHVYDTSFEIVDKDGNIRVHESTCELSFDDIKEESDEQYARESNRAANKRFRRR